MVSWLFPEFKFQWLVDESKKHLPLELDFEHEGWNAEKIMHFVKKFPFVKVLAFFSWGITTKMQAMTSVIHTCIHRITGTLLKNVLPSAWVLVGVRFFGFLRRRFRGRWLGLDYVKSYKTFFAFSRFLRLTGGIQLSAY